MSGGRVPRLRTDAARVAPAASPRGLSPAFAELHARLAIAVEYRDDVAALRILDAMTRTVEGEFVAPVFVAAAFHHLGRQAVPGPR
jgi:hypothetical protein